MGSTDLAQPRFDYEDINLVPKKCIVESRTECDAGVTFGKRRFKLPVVPANMECAIDEKLAETLAAAGFFYILHRFSVDTVRYGSDVRHSPSISVPKCAVARGCVSRCLHATGAVHTHNAHAHWRSASF